MSRSRPTTRSETQFSGGPSWPFAGWLGCCCVFFAAIVLLIVGLEYESATRENPELPFPFAQLWFPGILFALGLIGVVAGPEILYGASAGQRDKEAKH